MNMAERIQHLRKMKGVSQEELADKIGVSRQAVSKWESEQSTPEIEKIIIMSDYFEVTTDYLLKGIEGNPKAVKEEPDAGIFAAAGTAFNMIGLILAITIWYEKQTVIAIAIGLILMVMGCMIFGIGMTVGKPQTKIKAKKIFWMINAWIFGFILLSFIYFDFRSFYAIFLKQMMI